MLNEPGSVERKKTQREENVRDLPLAVLAGAEGYDQRAVQQQASLDGQCVLTGAEGTSREQQPVGFVEG